MPRVSVVIPTFNCSGYVARAVESVLTQTYSDFEIIVVDDGSIDDTAEKLRPYEKRLTYVHQPNSGASAARNRGLTMSTGEYVAYLDADDLWNPKKLELQVAFLDMHKQCGLVHGETSVINERDEIIHMRFNAETKRPVPQGACLTDLLQRSHIQTLTVVERRECIERVGGFDESLPIAQDYMHWIMVALEGWTFGYIAEPVGRYRWRSGSLMTGKKRLLEDYERIYSRLLNEIDLAKHMHGREAIHIVSGRLVSVQHELANLDYTEGRNAAARRRLARLIQRSPLNPGLYMDLFKACVHPTLQKKLRAIRS